ncbi:CbrC family protein [Bradymonas sediminis]|uniref:Uncharacterized protein n=1 Tax=Bradymonas sediminis TaxID=1548548 RepID=A0A2Z4FIT1_9DELT|nr:CbrC family protein [Bradymonas sediminis]AWV88793.1 hypothetical protein DN745_05340 [Bradymonas sediminis]TDP71791.1 hypothetical protein DFR33_1083 [Bradymonas sediminis]
MNLPNFKYHPDPIASGSIIESEDECECCGESRGYMYVGPVYAEEELDQALCPWCIADGSAHAKFDASFTDEDGIGDCDGCEEVSEDVVEEVAFRTPGFIGWQQEQWWTHCGDAGAFIGQAGHAELAAHGPQAILSIQDSTGLSGGEWEDFFKALDKDGSPVAYLFRCTKCSTVGGYQDCD